MSTAWRTAAALHAWERARYHARRSGFVLSVSVSKGGMTHAKIEYRRRDGTDAWETRDSVSWAGTTPALISAAIRWANARADQLAKADAAAATNAETAHA